MAETLNRFAGWYLHRGETQRAINVSSELIDVFQDLIRQGDEAAVLDLARVHHNQATLYQADFAARYSQLSPDDIPEIQRKKLARLVKAIGLYEQLIRDEPDVIQHRVDLADSCITLIGVHASMSDTEKAKAMSRKALDLLEPLAAAQPEVTPYQMSLAECRNNLAIIHLVDGNTDQLLKQLTLSLQHLAQVLYQEPWEPSPPQLLHKVQTMASSATSISDDDSWPSLWNTESGTPRHVRDVQFALILSGLGNYQRAIQVLDGLESVPFGDNRYHFALASALASCLEQAESKRDGFIERGAGALIRYIQRTELRHDGQWQPVIVMSQKDDRITVRFADRSGAEFQVPRAAIRHTVDQQRVDRVQGTPQLDALRRHSAWSTLLAKVSGDQ